MSAATLLPIALTLFSVAGAVLAYWIRRNDATTAEALKEIRAVADLTSKLHQTLFGPEGNNGLNGDTRNLKKASHRTNGFVNALCLFFGLECDDEGRVRWLDGVSPFERRLAERRASEDRRGGTDRRAPVVP